MRTDLRPTKTYTPGQHLPHDDFLKRVVKGVLLYWLLLTIAVLVLNAFGIQVSDALVGGAFGCGGLELLATSYIKVKKLLSGANGGDDAE